MFYLLVNWLLSALSLVIVAAIVPGIEISGFGTAMIAAVLIGFANVTLGLCAQNPDFPIGIAHFRSLLHRGQRPDAESCGSDDARLSGQRLSACVNRRASVGRGQHADAVGPVSALIISALFEINLTIPAVRAPVVLSVPAGSQLFCLGDSEDFHEQKFLRVAAELFQ